MRAGLSLRKAARELDPIAFNEFQLRLGPTWATANDPLVAAARYLTDVKWLAFRLRLPTWATAGGSLVSAARELDDVAWEEFKTRLGPTWATAGNSLVSAARYLAEAQWMAFQLRLAN